MAYKDGEEFTTYCDKPYDKHTYDMIMKDGSVLSYENYELMRYEWYQLRDKVKSVVVKDIKKGFK